MQPYSGSISIPMPLRTVRSAATIVVSDPQNGPGIVSSVKEDMRTSRVANSSGNGAGWCPVATPVPADSACLLQGIELHARQDGQVVLDEDVDRLIGVVEAEDDHGVFAALLDKGVQVFDVDAMGR